MALFTTPAVPDRPFWGLRPAGLTHRAQPSNCRPHAGRIAMLMRAAAAALVATLAADDAQASCWTDAGLTARAQALAQSSFPAVTRNMPQVLFCTRNEYAPNVGGVYSSGVHRITAGNWHPPGSLDMVLLHELGHAQVALQGGDGGSDGHGPGWVQAMADAGLLHEARRMAQHSAEAARAVAEFDDSHGPTEPPPAWQQTPPMAPQAMPPQPRAWRQVCFLRPQTFWVRLPHGQVMAQTQLVQVCQVVPG